MKGNNSFKYTSSIGRLTGLMSNKMARVMQSNLKKQGLTITPKQFIALNVLWETDGINQQQLANGLNRERATVTRLIDNMERDGLVERRRNEPDRRTNLVYLTKKGAGIKTKARNAANKTLDKALKGIAENDIVKWKALLAQVIKNLD